MLTGRLPGHHGILHNAWFDRRTGEQIITNSNDTWPWAMQHLAAGVESIHTVVRRTEPDTFTASVNEPCDSAPATRRSTSSVAATSRRCPRSPDGLAHTTERFVRPYKDYRWSSVVDHMGTDQAVGIWSGEYRGETYPHPRFMFCNFTLTDSAMHAGGPYSEIAAASIRDSDAPPRRDPGGGRARRASSTTPRSCSSPTTGWRRTTRPCSGDWDVALRDDGLTFRDEGYGFLYLDEPGSA